MIHSAVGASEQATHVDARRDDGVKLHVPLVDVTESPSTGLIAAALTRSGASAPPPPPQLAIVTMTKRPTDFGTWLAYHREVCGVRRFYRGLGPALFQGPLSRFGDTASNAGMLALWDSFDGTKNLPSAAKTVSASAAAAGFRVFLMPIDACKTILQGTVPPSAWRLTRRLRAARRRARAHVRGGGPAPRAGWAQRAGRSACVLTRPSVGCRAPRQST